MMKKDFSLRAQHKKKISGIIVLLLTLYLVLCPSLHFRIGNIFFGKVPSLYNVTMANFFFKHAAYPLIGKTPPFAHHQLSRTYFIQGDLDTAVREANEELILYPEHTKTYYILALTYGYMHREKEAIDTFSKYIEANPTTWAARNDKAWLQFRIGDIDGALATIEPAAKDINNPWVQNTYGVLLMNKKRYREAKQAFLHAKAFADKMDERLWGIAYPGNDPRIYGTGLQAMKDSIDENLQLVENQLDNK